MRNRLFKLIIIAALAAITFGRAQAQTEFGANLTHDQEPPPGGTTPPLTSTGDPRPLSSGTASFTLNNTETALTMTITVYNIDVTGTQTPDSNDNLVAAHIHAPAPPGMNGSVVWGFFGSPDNDNNPDNLVVTPFASAVGGTFSTTWDQPEGNSGNTLTAQLNNIKAGLAYINFHTVQFGGGEIRGQILTSQTLVVNTTADTDDGSCDASDCTLREAINAANAIGTDDTINFSLPPGSTISLLTELPAIDGNLVINGLGADSLTIQRSTADGTPEFRILKINPDRVVTINRLTVSNGIVRDEVAVGVGGGILNDSGTLNLVSCTVSGNYASAGGGLYNSAESPSTGATATLTITNSTISGNRAKDGGAGVMSFVMSNNGSTVLTITNSTISGNIVDPVGAGGGGVVSATSASGGAATATISNSTITNNRGGDAGGIASFVGGPDETTTITLRSTIVAGNFQTDGTTPGDIIGAVDPSSSFNLIGTGGSGGLVNGVNQNQVGVADPGLAPLGNYGGLMQTHALLAGSPALDKGTSKSLPLDKTLTTDQRGASFKRRVNLQLVPNATGGDGTDIGAFEVQPAFQFTFANYSVSESGTQATITVRLTAALTETATVDYATSNGTAVVGEDYTDTFCTLSFAPGVTTQSFTVPINDDALDEAAETVNLTLSNPIGAMLGAPDKATLTILDNDPLPTLAVASPTVTEGNAPSLVNFTVTLSEPSGRAVTVKYQTADGTAKAPADYTAKGPATLTFLPGETSKTVAVKIIGDRLDEPAETFRLVLSAPTSATVAVGTGTCTVNDNDPPPTISINNVVVTEPDTGTLAAVFTVRLSAPSGQSVSVKYATGGGTATASSDYMALALTTLTFSPGQTTKTVTVQVKGDTVKEANETFFVNLSAPVNATFLDSLGTGTITNDD